MMSLFFGYELVLSLATATLSFIFILVYYHYKKTYSYWANKGLKGPKPIPFFGNLWHMFTKNRIKLEIEWARNYGKIYGIYRSTDPTLVVADAEVIIQMCIKDFESMTNHENHPEFIPKTFRLFIFNLVDEHWKRVRNLLTPTFTSGKIKRMFKLLNECADDSVECFKEQLPARNESGQQEAIVNVKDLFSLYTMDGITRSCYGIKLERAGSNTLKGAATKDKFVKAALNIFNLSLMRMMILFTVPKFILRFYEFSVLDKKKYDDLTQIAAGIIKNRRQTGKKYDDYLQLLLDANSNDELELNELDQEENHHASLTTESLLEDQKKLAKVTTNIHQLTEDEILSQATLLMAVGLETTGSLLANCIYALAFHSNVQERLFSEIVKIAQKKDEDGGQFDFDYESITSCKYLDSVISEVLRMFPPAIVLQRQLKQNYRVEKYNLDLPKGTNILLAPYAVQNSEEYWENPEKFYPERFMPGNKERIVSGSYIPFGLGPRHCLGMRFSLTEAKIGLAKVMSHFRFEPAPNTIFPPIPKLPVTILVNKDPRVKLIARS